MAGACGAWGVPGAPAGAAVAAVPVPWGGVASPTLPPQLLENTFDLQRQMAIWERWGALDHMKCPHLEEENMHMNKSLAELMVDGYAD